MQQLLERDELLTYLNDALAAATGGEGRFVVLTGEAGAGKSALVRAFVAEHSSDASIRVGACDPLTTPRPLGPLQDVARQGTQISDALREGLPPATTFALLLDELRAATVPTVLVVEDVHWADASTLDLLRYLARRIVDVPVVVVVTHREDEGHVDHPARVMLGDIASGMGVARHVVPPLSKNAVRRLTEGTSIDPNALFEATEGNPFYVTEVLAAGPQEVPVRVVDVVLARAARLPGDARSVLEIASAMRTRLSPELLVEASAGDSLGLDACLMSGMLVLDHHAVRFRHEIARRAVESSLAPMRRRQIHQLLLRLLTASSADAATLAFHAHEAGDTEVFLTQSRLAADRAAALGAHREAAVHMAALLDGVKEQSPEERAVLLDRLSFEFYLTGDMDAAIAARNDALVVWRHIGDVRRTGDSLRWLSRLYWFAAREVESAAAAREAVELLEPEAAGHELGMTYSTLAQLAMLRANTAETIAWSTKALNLADSLDDIEVKVHTLNNLGTITFATDGSEALTSSLALALEHDMPDHAARAYANLMFASLCVGDVDAAARHGGEGLAYCIEHDLDAYRWYITAIRGRLALMVDDWEAGYAEASEALRPDATLLTRLIALAVLGRIASRRGDPRATELLDEAFAIASGTDEPQRLAPVFAAHAESAWLHNASLRPDILGSSPGALLVPYPWDRGEVAVWLQRLGQRVDADVAGDSPYSLSLAGDHAAAHAAWTALGRHYEAALAAIDGDDVMTLREAAGWLADRGAARVLQRASARLRELGAVGVRPPRASTASNPAGLTQREVEVLSLVASGLPDRDIAERLVLSQRTIHHHVAAVLRKLQVSSRREAGEAARSRGIELPM